MLMRVRFQWMWIAVAGLTLVLAGCGEQPGDGGGAKSPGAKPGAAKDKIKIGFIVKQPEERGFQLEWMFAGKAAAEHGFELLTIGALDGEKALTAIDTLGSKGAKGFVICTPDVKLGPAIVKRAKRYGLKFMSVDDQFVGIDDAPMTDVHHLGISARKIGEDVGKELYAQMQKRGWPPAETAVCAVTHEELPTAKERTDGAIDALIAAGFPKDKIFKAPQKTTDVKGAYEAVDILLIQQPDVNHWLICGMNDSAVLGAVRAMEKSAQRFTADSIVGVGINGTDCLDELRKEHLTGFYGSMLLQAKLHGQMTAEMVYKWIADGEEPQKDTRTVGILITRDNFEAILKEQGLAD